MGCVSLWRYWHSVIYISITFPYFVRRKSTFSIHFEISYLYRCFCFYSKESTNQSSVRNHITAVKNIFEYFWQSFTYLSFTSFKCVQSYRKYKLAILTWSRAVFNNAFGVKNNFDCFGNWSRYLLRKENEQHSSFYYVLIWFFRYIIA